MKSYKLYTDKQEIFECNIFLDGASLTAAKSRIIVETQDLKLMFEGTIDSEGTCKVPIKNLVGNEGDGFEIAMQGLDGGRVNIASCSLGAARACLEKSLNYVTERKQFGKKLSDFQSIQFKLADMSTHLEAARLMVLKAASELDNHEQDTIKSCAMAKRFATDIGFEICNQALQLHGGYGYLTEYQIERYVRDLRVHQILEGTNEIMRIIISRKLLENKK